MNFEDWMDALRGLAVQMFGYTEDRAAELDPDEWRPFFDEGYRASEALAENLTEAMVCDLADAAGR